MRACWQVGLLLLVQLASGCASRRCGTDAPPCAPGPPLLDCHVVERQEISADVSAVEPRSTVAFDASRYCNLPEREAQCLAATNSSLARLLEQEAAALDAQPKGLHHSPDSRQRTQQILYLQATHERNRAASAALQVFLRLTEAEAGSANLKSRLEEIGRMLVDVQRLQAAGMESPASQADVEAQQLELLYKQVDLEATIAQLNRQLVNLLGAEPPPETRFWPDADLRVDAAAPHGDEAQHLALLQRTDLCALRMAAGSSDGNDLDAMRALLGQSNAGLGLALSGCSLVSALHPKSGNDEAAIRQQQLSASVAEQERTLRHDVAAAVATLEARLVQIGLSRRRIEVEQRRLDALEKKRQVSPTAGFDARKVRLEVLDAEQDLLHDVIEWKIAMVKLHELQGELAIQCGFTAALDCGCGPCSE